MLRVLLLSLVSITLVLPTAANADDAVEEHQPSVSASWADWPAVGRFLSRLLSVEAVARPEPAAEETADAAQSDPVALEQEVALSAANVAAFSTELDADRPPLDAVRVEFELTDGTLATRSVADLIASDDPGLMELAAFSIGETLIGLEVGGAAGDTATERAIAKLRFAGELLDDTLKLHERR